MDAIPGSPGTPSPRFAKLNEAMSGFVERGEVPGLVTLLSVDGEVHVAALGSTTLSGNNPVRRDTIFRISSMTKSVTAVAALMLVEDSKLRLDDPVDALLPELADRRVLKRLDGPLTETVPAERPITLRDLLTFRIGFGLLGAHRSWGLGLSVITGPGDPAGSPGAFGWDGGLGTSWLSDPGKNQVAILMTQNIWESASAPAVYSDFWKHVRKCI
jgi:CubicO group peptidase (beta-lactamase class C family)